MYCVMSLFGRPISWFSTISDAFDFILYLESMDHPFDDYRVIFRR